MDQTVQLASIDFDAAPATLVGSPGAARDILTKTLDYASLALAADQVGGAQRCLDMSVDYAKTRHQYGRAIGSFQAIKHMCVDMLLDVEWARSTVQQAAWDAAHGTANSRRTQVLPRHSARRPTPSVAATTIQVHGGLGFTWEHDAHLYFKRARSSELFLGDPAYHRELFLQRAVD